MKAMKQLLNLADSGSKGTSNALNVFFFFVVVVYKDLAVVI